MRKMTAQIEAGLKPLADPERAKGMAAYMKTEDPFFGVGAKDTKGIYRDALKAFQPADRSDYERAVLDLWRRPCREMKYAAITAAKKYKTFITPDSIPLYRDLIERGRWWDFVDDIAVNLVGGTLGVAPETVWPLMDAWIDDENMWIRRTAILCQNRFKERTDERRLFAYCSKRFHEKEFFIRKAIGWALREYSKTRPEPVKRFLIRNKDKMAGLSFREGGKILIKNGLLEK